jgi:glycosyltransferase involved in cell wall biosynthesis
MTIPRNTDRVGTAPSTQAPVSVVVPVFNGENHLHELIESNQAQSHRKIEIIFTEGGGSDSS